MWKVWETCLKTIKFLQSNQLFQVKLCIVDFSLLQAQNVLRLDFWKENFEVTYVVHADLRLRLFPPSQISQWSKGIRPPDAPHLVWAQKRRCSQCAFLSAWANNQPVIFGKVLHGDGRPGSCYYAEWLSFPLVCRSNDTKRKWESGAARPVYLSNKSSCCAPAHKLFHACLEKCLKRFSQH